VSLSPLKSTLARIERVEPTRRALVDDDEILEESLRELASVLFGEIAAELASAAVVLSAEIEHRRANVVRVVADVGVAVAGARCKGPGAEAQREGRHRRHCNNSQDFLLWRATPF
jgi:hypothetical protein